MWLNNGTAVFSDSGQNIGNANGLAVGLGKLGADPDLDTFIVNSGEPNRVWGNS